MNIVFCVDQLPVAIKTRIILYRTVLILKTMLKTQALNPVCPPLYDALDTDSNQF